LTENRHSNFIIHSREEIEGIRRAAQAAASVREQLASMIRPGMSTAEIDNMAWRGISSYNLIADK